MTSCHVILHDMVELFNHYNLKNPKELSPCLVESLHKYDKKLVHYYFQLFSLFFDSCSSNGVSLREKFSGRLQSEGIKILVANVKQLTFEVTERCNLECLYCGYGEFYGTYGERKRKDLPVEYAINLLKYLSKSWDSEKNLSHNRRIYISFYGGEPLMNFPFIEAIVTYCNQLSLKHNSFIFSMTTNALLLKKYISFLVENDFRVLVSLDGNEKNHSYRQFANKQNSHKKVIENICFVEKKFPDFFNKNVSFNAVLHNKNSVEEINNYIENKFGKRPSIGELNVSGILKDKQKEFWNTYRNFNESLHESENYETLTDKLFIVTPVGRHVTNFLIKNMYFNKNDYMDLIYQNQKIYSPSGTCAPFAKKMFVTAQGKILACEKIDHKYALGRIDKSGVFIDEGKIKQLYNCNYDKMSIMCSKCYNSLNCVQCMFFLDLDRENISCNGFSGYISFKEQLRAMMEYLEKHPLKKKEVQEKYIFSY